MAACLDFNREMTFKTDAETGEPIKKLNLETGEEEFLSTDPAPKLKPFKIPQSLIPPKKNEVKMVCPSAFTTAITFLIPTTVCFYPILGILTVAIEVMIHLWAHRKNKSLKATNVYYQSPLHIMCKEFCWTCIEEEAKMKISKFQEKRAGRFKKYGLAYVRRIVT